MSKDKVLTEMKTIFKDVPYGIDHTMAVLKDAEAIMDGEGIKEVDHELISFVAILHDIGAVEAQRKYGSMDAEYQEKEGPVIARRILENIGYDPKLIERICFIIGHHHTPSRIDGIDFQIQWEADVLANLEYMEIKNHKDRLREYIEQNFKTSTGKSMALARFLKD